MSTGRVGEDAEKSRDDALSRRFLTWLLQSEPLFAPSVTAIKHKAASTVSSGHVDGARSRVLQGRIPEPSVDLADGHVGVGIPGNCQVANGVQ